MNPPRVVVSSSGVFHAYHLARAAQSAGYLHRFITSIFSRRESGLDMQRVVQLRSPAVLASALRLVPGSRARLYSYLAGDSLFDRLSERHVQDADIFNVFNNFGVQAMQTAQRGGAITVVERSSAHPVAQSEILTTEYKNFELDFASGDRRLIDRQRAEYELADYICVPSDFVWRTMAEQGVPEQKLRRVHLGFEPDLFAPGTKDDDVFRVVYAGIQSVRKGTYYLLRAFQELNLPNAELVLIGEPWPELRSVLAEFDGTYRALSYVSQPELAKWFQRSSVFVMPSIEDGFGMVVYEAAACGLPVIWTRNVGAALRDGKDGFEIPIADERALAEKILTLYENEAQRREMGQSAQQYVQQFTWQNYHREVIAHYDSMLAAQRN